MSKKDKPKLSLIKGNGSSKNTRKSEFLTSRTLVEQSDTFIEDVRQRASGVSEEVFEEEFEHRMYGYSGSMPQSVHLALMRVAKLIDKRFAADGYLRALDDPGALTTTDPAFCGLPVRDVAQCFEGYKTIFLDFCVYSMMGGSPRFTFEAPMRNDNIPRKGKLADMQADIAAFLFFETLDTYSLFNKRGINVDPDDVGRNAPAVYHGKEYVQKFFRKLDDFFGKNPPKKEIRDNIAIEILDSPMYGIETVTKGFLEHFESTIDSEPVRRSKQDHPSRLLDRSIDNSSNKPKLRLLRGSGTRKTGDSTNQTPSLILYRGDLEK